MKGFIEMVKTAGTITVVIGGMALIAVTLVKLVFTAATGV